MTRGIFHGFGHFGKSQESDLSFGVFRWSPLCRVLHTCEREKERDKRRGTRTERMLNEVTLWEKG